MVFSPLKYDIYQTELMIFFLQLTRMFVLKYKLKEGSSGLI